MKLPIWGKSDFDGKYYPIPLDRIQDDFKTGFSKGCGCQLCSFMFKHFSSKLVQLDPGFSKSSWIIKNE